MQFFFSFRLTPSIDLFPECQVVILPELGQVQQMHELYNLLAFPKIRWLSVTKLIDHKVSFGWSYPMVAAWYSIRYLDYNLMLFTAVNFALLTFIEPLVQSQCLKIKSHPMDIVHFVQKTFTPLFLPWCFCLQMLFSSVVNQLWTQTNSRSLGPNQIIKYICNKVCPSLQQIYNSCLFSFFCFLLC